MMSEDNDSMTPMTPTAGQVLDFELDRLEEKITNVEKSQRLTAESMISLEARVAQLEQGAPPPDPDPEPDPEPTPPPTEPELGLTVLAASKLRNVPVPYRRGDTPEIYGFDPGVAGDHFWGIGAYEAGHHAGSYPEPPAHSVVTTDKGWLVPYERCPIRSMPIKLRVPVLEAWSCFRMELAPNFRWGKSTKIGGFIGADGRTTFSSRICVWDWNLDGNTQLGVYYYHPSQKNSWGDEIRKPYPLTPGNAYELAFHTRVVPGKAEGSFDLYVRREGADAPWVNVAAKGGIFWSNAVEISHWYWSHMYGGPWCVWAPPGDGPWLMFLRDFAVAEKRQDLYPWARG